MIDDDALSGLLTTSLTDDQTRELARIKRRLSRVARDVEATPVSGMKVTFDFHLDIPEERRFRSALVVTRNGTFRKLVIRFPGWPPDVLSEDALVEHAGELVSDVNGPRGADFRVAQGNRMVGSAENQLHIEYDEDDPIDTDEALTFIKDATGWWSDEFFGGLNDPV